MNREVFMTYLLPVIITALSGLAGWIGLQLKAIYQKHVNDKTKQAVVRTCVKAVEQLYHDLDGAAKLEKAEEGIVEMLKEKGIPISKLEMDALIEAVVCEFNYGISGKDKEPEKVAPLPQPDGLPEPEYSEEEGASL